MPLDEETRRLHSLMICRDFAAELERSLREDDLDEVGRQSAKYHLQVARDAIAAMERPATA